jgi:hypothetical protein
MIDARARLAFRDHVPGTAVELDRAEEVARDLVAPVAEAALR